MSGLLPTIERRITARFRLHPPQRFSSRMALWALATASALFLLSAVPRYGRAVQGLPWMAVLAAAILMLPAFFHWMRWRLLWRLRNRLLVTYALIGLTPVVLFALLAGIAGYVLFGQFANFAASSEINTQLAELAADNEALALHFQQELRSLRLPDSPSATLPLLLPGEAQAIVGTPGLKVGVYLDGRLQSLDVAAGHGLTSVPTPPAWVQSSFRGLVLNDDHVYFRAVTREPAGAHTVTVITSLPLDRSFLARVASGLGRVTLLPKVQFRNDNLSPERAELSELDTAAQHRKDPVEVQYSHADMGTITGGDLPKRGNLFDIPINFPTTLETVGWSTGKKTAMIALVTSRPSLLYQRLFRDSVLIGGGIRIALILTAVIFALLELLAVYLASRLSRTITLSIRDLYHATREVDQGRLNYRIPVARQDQLAALSRSFNTMSASLGRLIEEQKEKERMQSELAIAQEVQSNLFPSCDVRLGDLELHGLCRPARTVSGDYYDFIVLNQSSLCLAIGDISGKGISAALLMAGLHSAVRAYRLVGAELPAGGAASAEMFQSPGNLMRLLNLHLYRSTQQEKYATLFLAYYDAATRQLRYSNGGQLPPLILRTDGTLLRLDRGGTVVGLLDNMRYEEGAVTLESGDILIAYSDGVTEPENAFGDFGESRLVELVSQNRKRPLSEISACVVEAIADWIGADEQPDDITLVLARQH